MICSHCLQEKPKSDFPKKGKTCKRCRADYMKEWNKKNPEKVKLSAKKSREKNKEKIKASKKRCYENKREYYISKARQNHLNNLEERKQYQREYYARPDVRKRYNDKYKLRMETEPIFRFKQRMRQRLIDAVKAQNAKKSQRTIDYLGCTISFFVGYIEGQFQEGMSWNNYGQWHLDHILPISSFDLTKESERKKCFHYTNLQPLWAEENLKKGTRIA